MESTEVSGTDGGVEGSGTSDTSPGDEVAV